MPCQLPRNSRQISRVFQMASSVRSGWAAAQVQTAAARSTRSRLWAAQEKANERPVRLKSVKPIWAKVQKKVRPAIAKST